MQSFVSRVLSLFVAAVLSLFVCLFVSFTGSDQDLLLLLYSEEQNIRLTTTGPDFCSDLFVAPAAEAAIATESNALRSHISNPTRIPETSSVPLISRRR